MKIYEIIIGNTYGDTTRSVLVASEEPLDETNINIRAIAGLTPEIEFDRGGDEQFVLEVNVPVLRGNAWNAEEAFEIDDIREKYFKRKEA